MVIFVVALIATSWTVQILAIILSRKKAAAQSEPLPIREYLSPKLVMLTMLTPSILLFIFIGLGYIPLDWDMLGVSSPSFFGVALGVAVPIAYTAVAFLVLRRFSDLKNFSKDKDGRWKLEGISTILDKFFPPPKKPIVYLLDIFISVIVMSVFLLPLALGEELIWRGYLQTNFIEQFGAYGILLIGLIWGFWHLPLNLVGYNAPEIPKLNSFVFFIIHTVAMSAVFGWLVLVTGSIWVAVIAHAANNVLEGLLHGFLSPRINPIKYKSIEIFVYTVFGIVAFLWIFLSL